MVLFVVAAPSDGRNTPQFCNGGEVNWAPYPPPPPDPNNYYFYPPNYPQTPEQQQQFWEHYNAMCSYMAEMSQNYNYPPYCYPPHLYTPPPPPPNLQYASDSDECGYSSTDEMNYYAAFFKKYPPPIQPYRGYYQENRAQTPKIIITPSNSNANSQDRDLACDSDQDQSDQSINQCSQSSPSVNEDSEATTDGSDTEVEEDNPSKLPGLQTIKSVPDISVYKDCSITDIQSLNSDDDDEDEEECNEGEVEEEYDEQEQQDLPHQLSVIFEESETSETESIKKIKRKDPEEMETTSEGESSTATLDHGNDDTDDDEIDTESSTVLVRLPLKLKFSKTENNEEVTTVTVGDSEIQASPEDDEIREGDLIIQEVTKDEEEPEVSVTFTIPKKRNKSLDESVTSLIDITPAVINSENDEQSPRSSDELRTGTQLKDDIEDICDNEISVAVSIIGDCNREDRRDSARSTSESPVDFWKELSCDDIPSKSKYMQSDLNVNVTLAPKGLSKSGSRSPYDNLTSEGEESKPEESDGHWEDDSSSTSVQTVRIGKRSGSDHFSSSEFETAGTAEETEEETKISMLDRTTECNDNQDRRSTHEVELDDEVEEESNNIPIEDLLYNDDSSSSNDDDDESTSSSSSSESSEESESEVSKEVEETATTSTGSSSRAEEKIDDDVFLSESTKSEGSNHLAVEQKPRNIRGNSCKSHEESEEDDSGVTSDMSRHISETDTDPECGSELRKLSPYQRASTHSRLFKLLQDECQDEENETEDKKSCDDSESLCSRKEKLSLPLQNSTVSDQDSMSSSSGINSPASPTVSDRLVKELVQSLLHKKKGRHFRKLPMDKLYAAAMRILKEDMDPYDTVSSTSDDSFRYSPISDSTASQTNNNTATNHSTQNHELYGGNYYDYCDYYNTWGNPYYYSGVEDSLGYDILPSRAFRILQERAQTPHGFSSGTIEGLTAKCPRVLNSNEVPKEETEALLPDPCPPASSSSET